MARIEFSAAGISKTFNRRKIFSGIEFALRENDSLAITGRNGSGKSTLLKILAGVLSATRGTVTMALDGALIQQSDRHASVGLVSPYLQLYDEFTGWENLDLFRRIRAVAVPDAMLTELLQRVNLLSRKDDEVRTYSSGMKQRLKYAFALLHRPPLLLLDEPTSNLDAEGIATVREIIREQKERGVLIIATNDPEDIGYCSRSIDLNVQPGGKSRV